MDTKEAGLESKKEKRKHMCVVKKERLSASYKSL